MFPGGGYKLKVRKIKVPPDWQLKFSPLSFLRMHIFSIPFALACIVIIYCRDLSLSNDYDVNMTICLTVHSTGPHAGPC